MRSISISRPSPALLVAILALVAAFGGTSYAAATFSGKLIKKQSTPGNRLQNNTVSGKQVNEASLGQVPNADRANLAGSADSAQNAQNAVNAQTAVNSTQLNGRTYDKFQANETRVRFGESASIPTNTGTSATANCAAGEHAIGGGGGFVIPGTSSATELEAPVTASMPVPVNPGSSPMTGWRLSGRNLTGVNRVLRAYAICVPDTAQ